MRERTKRRTLAALTVAVAVALSLAGCGGGGEPNAKASAPPKPKEVSGNVTVTVPSDNPGDIAQRNKLAKAFMTTNPNVKVKIQVVPVENYDQKVQTMIAGGNPPDIFTSGDVQIPNIVAKKFALDLKPYMQRDNYDVGDFYPQIIDNLTYNGQLVGLGDNWDTQVMYYNADLFRQAGVAPPTDAWTWDDFMAAARQITSGSGSGKTYGAVFDNWSAPYFDQIWANGGDPYPENGTKCGYDSPQSKQAFDQIVSLYRDGLSPTPTQFSGQGAMQFFLSGRVGMMIGSGRWGAYELRDVKKFAWKIAPRPKASAGRANFFHLSMFAIARTSKNPEAAFEFLKYMVSEEGIKEGLSGMQGIPARRSIAESASFRDLPFNVEHDTVAPFVASLPTVHRSPMLPNFNEVQDAVDAQLDSVWTLKESPETVLPKVCRAVTPKLQAGGAVGGG